MGSTDHDKGRVEEDPISRVADSRDSRVAKKVANQTPEEERPS